MVGAAEGGLDSEVAEYGGSWGRWKGGVVGCWGWLGKFVTTVDLFDCGLAVRGWA